MKNNEMRATGLVGEEVGFEREGCDWATGQETGSKERVHHKRRLRQEHTRNVGG